MLVVGAPTRSASACRGRCSDAGDRVGRARRPRRSPDCPPGVVVLDRPADADEYARVLYARAPRGRRARARRRARRAARRAASARRSPTGSAALPTASSRAGDPRAGERARPIGVFDSGLGGLTVLRSLIDLLPGESMLLLRRHRPVPVRPEARRRGAQVLARDRRPARRARRQADRRRVQQRDLGRARRAARHGSPVPVIGVIEPGLRAAAAGDPQRARRRHRHGRHDRVGRVPARRRRDSPDPSSSRARRARASSSSSRRATSTRDQVHVLAERLLAPVRAAGVDTLVLGCTHYPLLARTIGDVMGQGRRAGLERRRDRVRRARARSSERGLARAR